MLNNVAAMERFLKIAIAERVQDPDEAEKVRICKHWYDILVTDMGLTAEDIIFDPNSLTVATGIEEHNIYGVDFINARRIIKEYADPAEFNVGPGQRELDQATKKQRDVGFCMREDTGS
ncbi:hypothetical protein PInf_008409 [Phytophthora infestans]|nr:hypothetical protein PInf_008409 [Phytophthora infestans]